MDDHRLLQRFLEYVQIDTTSNESAGTLPSSEGQRELGRLLVAELKEMGLEDAELDDQGFVFATIPATPGFERVPTLGFLAHLDTAPDCLGAGVKPKVHHNYQGGDITINANLDLHLNPKEDPDMARYLGHDLITSDGTTLLGADDKSGIAIIMSMAETVLSDSNLSHGKLRIAFTPDEEISVGGAAAFDVQKFGAQSAITLDGDGIGEYNLENFNAASIEVKILGTNIHTAEAKGKMVHALKLAMEFDECVPRVERAEQSEGYEGFYHLLTLTGEVGEANMHYLIRDFEEESFQLRKQTFMDAAQKINATYGDGRVTLVITDEYQNMLGPVSKEKRLIDAMLSAYDRVGLPAVRTPIRGGTDGATLAFKGLPCPNLFLGGHNYHSVKEYVSLQAMCKARDLLIETIRILAQ